MSEAEQAEVQHINGDDVVAIASSSLCGNRWDGTLAFLTRSDASAGNKQKGVSSIASGWHAGLIPFQTGLGDIAWPASDFVVVGTDVGGVVGFSVTNEFLGQISATDTDRPTAALAARVHAGPVLALAGHAGRLSSSAMDSTVRVWDMATGDVTREYTDYDADVTSLAICPSAPWFVAAATADACVAVIDDRAQTKQVSAQADVTLTAIAFPTESETDLIIGCDDGTVLTLDLRKLTDQSLNAQLRDAKRLISQHAGRVNDLALGPSDRVCSVGDDFRVLTPGNDVTGASRHSDLLTACSWSHGSSTVYAGGYDRTVSARQVA